MSARKDRENWERFRDDWENNRIVVHVDPFKAMDAWKNGVTHTLAPMVWFFGLLCIPASLILAFFFFWWVIPLHSDDFAGGDSAWADRFSRLPLYIPASAREGYDPRDARG